MMLVICLAFAAGCTTKQNPKSCNDGVCNDPALPFCDVDGTVGGEPNTCQAVDCQPDEFVACSGDKAIRCNATASNYVVVSCERGCDAALGGCLSCATNDQCTSNAPICDDQSHECRRCVADDECGSRVCDPDSGACVAEAQIVYATVSGSSGGDCTQAMPCTLQRAVQVAAASSARSVVRMLPGNYADDLVLRAPMQIIATGAKLQGGSFAVTDGGNVSVRALTFDLGIGDLRCETTNVGTGALHLRDLEVRSANELKYFLCQGSLRNVRIDVGVNIGSSRLEADRVLSSNWQFTGPTDTIGTTTDVRVTNSVFRDGLVHFGVGRIQTKFAFNSFHYAGNEFYVVACPTSGTATALFENNIIVGGTADVLQGTGCMTSKNILFPQAAGYSSGNIKMDPKFVNAAAGDYHLQAGSPAIDAAVASSSLSTDHDFENAMRPQGAALDIGAFERKP